MALAASPEQRVAGSSRERHSSSMKPMASAALPSLAPSRIDQAYAANGRLRSVTLPSQPSSGDCAISRHASPHGGFFLACDAHHSLNSPACSCVSITLSLPCGEQKRQKRLDSKANWERLSFRNCLQGACNLGTLVKSTKERRLSTLWPRRDPEAPQRRAGVKASGAREKSLDQNQKRKAGYRSWKSNSIN